MTWRLRQGNQMNIEYKTGDIIKEFDEYFLILDIVESRNKYYIYLKYLCLTHHFGSIQFGWFSTQKISRIE